MKATRPWRVLMTSDAVGGVFSYSLTLASALAEHDASTTLALLGPGLSPDQRRRTREIPGLTVVEIGHPLDWLARDPAEIAATAEAVVAIAREVSPDFVHLHAPSLARTARPWPCPVVGVAHSCLATWWDAVKGGEPPPDFSWKTDVLREGYLACDRVIAPTAAFAEATARLHRIPPPSVCFNGGDWPPIREEPVAREVVFTAGRLWDEGKDLATLDRAAATLGCQVHAAGPLAGPDGSRIDLPHLSTLGDLDAEALAEWLARAGIFVSCALYEPFGLAVMEAARSGCALVLSDIPSFRELWEGAAVFVKPGDDPAFAKALRRLAGDSAERQGLAMAARTRAARYGLQAMGDHVWRLYSILSPALFEAAA